MKTKKIKVSTIVIASVWLVNGLLCKVLNLVPRHQLIVSRILGDNYSRSITFIIGLLEITIGIWFLAGYKKRTNVIIQIVAVAIMNILEFILAQDLLLWKQLNAVFAFLFIAFIAYNNLNDNPKLYA